MDIKTVDSSVTIADPMYARQKELVSRMRTSALACTDDSLLSSRHALQGITALRVYHQVNRIIKYLDMMDKLEDKLYSSIDYAIDHAEESNPSTITALISIQNQLQKSMIESHKLLQPYLDIQEFTIMDLAQASTDSSTSDSSPALMNSEDRDRLRTTAQTILKELQISSKEGDTCE